jgi:hypothetical protein
MRFFLLIFLMAWNVESALEYSPGSKNASLYFISPKHQEIINGEVSIKFGLRNFGVSPAGVEVPGTGHHHLIIDAELPPVNQPIRSDKNHVHFGKGQTEVQLKLEPGSHTLQLLLGDHRHIPHNPAIASEQITILVR